MTREEAIQIIRGTYHTDEEMNALESLIPELRESEGERMRRCIGMALTDVDEQRFKDFGTTLKDCLAWLEKQEETPMPNSTELIEMWHKAKAILKEKDFRGDEWRLAQNAFMDGFARGTCVKFEKQKEQKPAWSEEDEKHINLILLVLDIQQCWDGATGKKFNPYQDEIDWLKSLRPSWKPSEEHLSALLAIFNDPDNIGSQTCQLALSDLYEQLKKL